MRAGIDARAASEAAHWMMRLQGGELDEAAWQALARWRAARAEHETAWQRAEHVCRTFGMLPAPAAPSAEERLLILETLHQIDAMLDGLGAKVRTAFLLSQLEGMAYADIAARLHVSERTVKRYMVQALTQCILLLA